MRDNNYIYDNNRTHYSNFQLFYYVNLEVFLKL